MTYDWQTALARGLAVVSVLDDAVAVGLASDEALELRRLPNLAATGLDLLVRGRQHVISLPAQAAGAGEQPFANLGKPGYEAETRELVRLSDELDYASRATPDSLTRVSRETTDTPDAHGALRSPHHPDP
ncbi:MAG: hypothetical protein ABI873_06565 [Marmoricola sp.]